MKCCRGLRSQGRNICNASVKGHIAPISRLSRFLAAVSQTIVCEKVDSLPIAPNLRLKITLEVTPESGMS